MTTEAVRGSWLERSWDQFKPGLGTTGTEGSPVSLLSLMQLLHRCLYPTISYMGQQQVICPLHGIGVAYGPWEGGYRVTWVLENKPLMSRPDAGSLVWFQAGAELSEPCFLLAYGQFPFLALPWRALMGAHLTACCLHQVLSKNTRKSSRESVRYRHSEVM